MTNFKDVSVGDRVRLTYGNGDLAEFTVVGVGDTGRWLEAESRFFFYEAEEVELEILPKPLPTKQYTLIGHPTDPEFFPYIFLDGDWYEVASNVRTNESIVREFMETQGFKVLFEGVEDEA